MTYVIAEAGSIADGNRWKMHQQIDIAKGAGADAVKFQWTSNHHKMAERRNVPPETYRLLAWGEPLLNELAEHAHDCDIDFMATGYLSKDFGVLAHHVDAFKVASFEALDDAVIEAALEARDDAPHVYVSTGMLTEEQCFTLRERYPGASLLHCVSAYPTPPKDVHLHLLGLAHEDSGRLFAGYSDHTPPSSILGAQMGALAVAAGARVIEVHFKLNDTSSVHPDAPHSRTPKELLRYIANIREAERVIGKGTKQVRDSERANLKHQVGAR